MFGLDSTAYPSEPSLVVPWTKSIPYSILPLDFSFFICNFTVNLDFPAAGVPLNNSNPGRSPPQEVIFSREPGHPPRSLRRYSRCANRRTKRLATQSSLALVTGNSYAPTHHSLEPERTRPNGIRHGPCPVLIPILDSAPGPAKNVGARRPAVQRESNSRGPLLTATASAIRGLAEQRRPGHGHEHGHGPRRGTIFQHRQ